MHRMLKVELENLKKKHKDLIEESRTWKDQVLKFLSAQDFCVILFLAHFIHSSLI